MHLISGVWCFCILGFVLHSVRRRHRLGPVVCPVSVIGICGSSFRVCCPFIFWCLLFFLVSIVPLLESDGPPFQAPLSFFRNRCPLFVV